MSEILNIAELDTVRRYDDRVHRGQDTVGDLPRDGCPVSFRLLDTDITKCPDNLILTSPLLFLLSLNLQMSLVGISSEVVCVIISRKVRISAVTHGAERCCASEIRCSVPD